MKELTVVVVLKSFNQSLPLHKGVKGGVEIRETPKVYGGSRVPGSTETNPALQKRKCGYFYGTDIFFNADIFMEQIFV